MPSPHVARLPVRPIYRCIQCVTAAAALLGSFVLADPAGANPVSLTFAEAQRLAVERSRQITAKDYAITASQNMAVAAGQLPDPVLKAGIDNLPVSGEERFSTGNDFMTMRRVGVMQEITRRDKRRFRSERYEREAERGIAEKGMAIASIQRDAAQAWLDLYYAQKAADIVAEFGAQTELELQAAEGAYRGGRGTQAAVLAAKSANTAFANRQIEVQQRVANVSTALSRWTGQVTNARLDAPPVMDTTRLNVADLETHLSHHPEIAVLKKQEEIAQAEANLAQANKKADWTVEVAYQQRGSAYSDMVSVGVSIPLQWNQSKRQDRELAAKLATVEQLKAEREEMLRDHVAQTQAMINDWQAGRDTLARYHQDLIPLANQRTAAAIAAYRGAKSSLADVLMARRAEIETRLEALRLENKVGRLWAQLNYLFPDTTLLPASTMTSGAQQ